MRKGTSPPAAGASADGETAESAATVEEESDTVEAPWLACETSWSSDGAFNAAPGPSLSAGGTDDSVGDAALASACGVDCSERSSAGASAGAGRT